MSGLVSIVTPRTWRVVTARARAHCIKGVPSPPCSGRSSLRAAEGGRMARVCGFDGGVASPESVSSVSKAVAREADDLEVEDVGGGSVGEREEEAMDEGWGDEAEAELELGLALGSVKKGKAAAASPHRVSCCRILTAKDFPSRASRRSPCSFVSASSGTNLGGGAGVVGTKRTAETVSPDVGVSSHPPRSAFV